MTAVIAPFVRQSLGRAQLSESSGHRMLVEVARCYLGADGLVWRTHYSFAPVLGSWAGMAAAGLHCHSDGIAYTWPLQHDSLSLTRWLRASRERVLRDLDGRGKAPVTRSQSPRTSLPVGSIGEAKLLRPRFKGKHVKLLPLRTFSMTGKTKNFGHLKKIVFLSFFCYYSKIPVTQNFP